MPNLKKSLLINAVMLIGCFSMILLMGVFYLIGRILKMSPNNEILFNNVLGLMVSAYVGILIALELSEKWGLLPKEEHEKQIEQPKKVLEPDRRIRNISNIALAFSGLYFIAIIFCMLCHPINILRSPNRKLAYSVIPLLCFIFSLLMRNGRQYANHALGGLIVVAGVISLFFEYPQQSVGNWQIAEVVVYIFSNIIIMLYGLFFIFIKKIIKPSNKEIIK